MKTYERKYNTLARPQYADPLVITLVIHTLENKVTKLLKTKQPMPTAKADIFNKLVFHCLICS